MSLTPSIRVLRDKCNTRPSGHDSRSGTATPMAIPRLRELTVPPPLPPCPLIDISAGYDPGWAWGNDPSAPDFARAVSVKPGSSLLGDALRSRQGKELDYRLTQQPFDERRRNSSISTVTNGGRDYEMTDDCSTIADNDALALTPTSTAELKGELELRQRTVELSSQSYDKRLLSRIGGPNTPKRQSLPYTPGGGQEGGQMSSNGIEPHNNTLQNLSMQERRHASMDSASSIRWPASGPWNERGIMETNRPNVSRHGSLISEDSGSSHRGSYDQTMFAGDDVYMEDSQLGNLYLEERSPTSPKAGSKRRASSPRERDDRSSISSASGQSDIHHRRSVQQLPTRTSPASRFHPNHSSVSSASSAGPRHGSLGSSLGLASIPSSATSYGSGRMSPSLLSSSVDVEFRDAALPVDPKGVTSSPVVVQRPRTLSESTQSTTGQPSKDNTDSSRHSSTSNSQTVYICECCPKKPRKFDTEEELNQHENEKQYTCQYCTNRFKNKNEAERHQNSLHLRRHSWSCAALSGIEAAFYGPSPASPSDICGYCGQEFPNPPEWDVRAEHLNQVHKFAECNQGKKFFRADHFRQHLKHSHQGTSGKWTSILENACMKDEPPPERRVSPVAVSAPTARAPPALMITTAGLTGTDLHPASGSLTPRDS